LGNPVQGMPLLLKEANLTQITNSNGTAQFSSLPIANYTVSYDWRLQSETRNISLTYTKKIDFHVYLSDLTILLIVAIVAALVVAVMAIAKMRHR
jgi:subtilase family serine protease